MHFLQKRCDAPLCVSGVYSHDSREKLDRVLLRSLERVTPDDGAEATAVANGADFFNTSSSLSSVGPPEKNTMRLPLKVPWTTCRTRSAGERHRLGVAPAFNGQLEVVVGVVSGWVHTEATGGPMLETLVDWQDHQLAGSCQPPMGQEERQARLGPRVVTLLPAQNLPHANEHVGASNRGCDFGHCASDRHQSPLTLPVQPTPSRIRSA